MEEQKFVSISEIKQWLLKTFPEVLKHTSKKCLILGDPKTYTYTSQKLMPRDVEVNEYLHRVALMWRLKAVQFPEGCECSHLCGNKGCANPKHLHAEPHGINMTRKVCHKKKRKSCTKHIPKCI